MDCNIFEYSHFSSASALTNVNVNELFVEAVRLVQMKSILLNQANIAAIKDMKRDTIPVL